MLLFLVILVIDPTYKEICNGDTGHAEAMKSFDPAKIGFGDLLEIFCNTRSDYDKSPRE
jgi:peptide methionine sulfoxide reductase MsrA